MRLLLDTHVVLWWLTDDETLSDRIKSLLDREVDVAISPITVWEVTIKQALGKIEGPEDLAECIRGCGFAEVPIRSEHALAAGRLPDIHRDPFDRMLIAQAQREQFTLVTRDAYIHKYDVQTMDA